MLPFPKLSVFVIMLVACDNWWQNCNKTKIIKLDEVKKHQFTTRFSVLKMCISYIKIHCNAIHALLLLYITSLNCCIVFFYKDNVYLKLGRKVD